MGTILGSRMGCIMSAIMGPMMELIPGCIMGPIMGSIVNQCGLMSPSPVFGPDEDEE
jgi:uncharacterized membrane protein YdjX (TVP38/TMEM64 family)